MHIHYSMNIISMKELSIRYKIPSHAYYENSVAIVLVAVAFFFFTILCYGRLSRSSKHVREYERDRLSECERECVCEMHVAFLVKDQLVKPHQIYSNAIRLVYPRVCVCVCACETVKSLSFMCNILRFC